MGYSNYQCLECFPDFELKEMSFNQPCITKIINTYGKSTNNYIPSINICPSIPKLTEISANPTCVACLNKSANIYADPDCISCWLTYNYAWGRCQPQQSSGLNFYASDIVLNNSSNTSWVGDGLIQQGCTSDYPGIVGIPNIPNNTNHTTPVPATLTYTLTGLPNHFGLTFFMNLFKIDYWAADASNKSPSPLKLSVFVDSPNAVSNQIVLQLNNSVGANICQ